jgi:hypothetical protein
MPDIRPDELPIASTLANNNYIIINVGTSLKRIAKSTLINLLNVLTNDNMTDINNLTHNGDGNSFLDNSGTYRTVTWNDITSKPFSTLNSEQFVVNESGELSVTNASSIDFSDLQAMLVSGQNIDIAADVENETLTFETIGETILTYANNTVYAIGDIVIYEDNLYKRVNAGMDTEWISSNWTCLSSGSTGQNAYVHIKYSAIQPTQDSDMTDTPNAYMGMYCDNVQEASTTYTDYTWYKIKGENGNDGINGADGASPTIDPITKHWFVGLTDTNVIAEGKDGNKWYSGTTYPTDVKNGDMFLSMAVATLGNVYQYELANTSWALQGNLYGGGAVINDTTPSVSACYSSTKVETFKTTISSDLTLTVAGWDSTTKQQTVNTTVNTNKLNTPIPNVSSLEEYANKGVKLISETAAGLTFECKNIPSNNLVFKLKSEVLA